ncbi:MAG: hypothetical protein CL942_04280 [Desulfovibrio sp.]|nr:hypothetical protein [Desulfovibrio sp.]|tara:strand:+ start:61966 stop:63012 length:1047 start_codon:yes stop_codon:yes gene_type:complete
MASIEKRGPYQYRCKIRRKGFPSVTKTFPTRAKAQEWANKVESDQKLGSYVDRREADAVSLHEALGRYSDEYIPKLKHSKREMDRAVAIQKRSIASLALSVVKAKDVADFIKEREKEGASANTIRLDLALISRAFETAISDWGMDYLYNPVKKAKKPRLPGGRTRRLMPAPKNVKDAKSEEERLLEACADKLRPVVEFALETAMRRAEIAEMIWENVDLKRRSVFLGMTKNTESRTVPLSPTALNILKSIPMNISGSVFGYTNPDHITQAMKRAVKKAELKDLRFHDLRHEATSRLFENTDLDVMEIKMITGHKSMQMLARYAHLRADRLADRLAGIPRGGETSNTGG